MNTKKKNDTIDYVVTGNPGKKQIPGIAIFNTKKKNNNNSCHEEIMRNTFELDPYLISNLKRFHI